MRLALIICLLLLLAYATVGRWYFNGQVAKISTVLLCLILIPNTVLEVRWQLAEQRGSAIVREVSHNPHGYLHCARFTEALFDVGLRAGEVSRAKPDEAYVHYETCRDYMAWLDGDKNRATDQQIIALHVIVHEAIHVGGEYDEGVTECRAMAADIGILTELGASAPEAQRMHQVYLTSVYPRLNSDYHRQC